MFTNIEPNEYIIRKYWIAQIVFIICCIFFFGGLTYIVYFFKEVTSIGIFKDVGVLKFMRYFFPFLLFTLTWVLYLEIKDGIKYKVVHHIPKKYFKVRVYHNMYLISYKDYAWNLGRYAQRFFELGDGERLLKFETHHSPDKRIRNIIKYL